MLNSGRRDRNNYWERIQAGANNQGIVTCVLFAPKPQLIFNQIYNKQANSSTLASNSSQTSSEKSPGKNISMLQHKNSTKEKKNYQGAHVLVSAVGCEGVIKVFLNKLNL